MSILAEEVKSRKGQDNSEREGERGVNVINIIWSFCKDTIIKTVSYWFINKEIQQCIRIESLKIDTCLYGNCLSDIENQWNKDELFDK